MADGAFLEDFTVVELGGLVAVPRAGKTLRQMGARVIKVEPPDQGDRARRHGPFPADVPQRDASGLFLALNAGKESITLDVGCATGRWLLGELLQKSDAIVHDLGPAEAAALGLSADTQPERFPSLVVAAVTGFGQSGSRAGWKSTDLVAWHAAGVGHRFMGDPERRPLRSPFAYADTYGGMLAAHAIVTALWERRRSGLGQVIDISTVEALAANVLAYGLLSLFHEGGEMGTRSPYVNQTLRSAPPAGRFSCKDGNVQISALEPGQWQRLIVALGTPDWAAAFDSTPQGRLPYHELITVEVEAWTSERTTEEVFRTLAEARVPCQIQKTAETVLEDEHLRARQAFIRVESGGRSWELPGAPWRSDATPREPELHAPSLSEHTQAALQALGLSSLEIEGLRTAGIV